MKKSIFGFAALVIVFVFGTMMSCSKKAEEVVPMQVEEVNASIDTLVGDTLLVEGTVEHICQHSGMKLVLEGAEFHCVAEEAFDQALMGQKVRINGVVCEQRLVAEDIQKMEEAIIAKMVEDSINGIEHHCCGEKAEGEEHQCCAENAEKHECCGENAEQAEGEHQCCGENHEEGEECPMKEVKELKAKLAENVENGMDYVVVGYYLQVLSVEPVVEEVAE